MVTAVQMQAKETVMPPPSKEDVILAILDRLLTLAEEKEGAVPNIVPYEFDLAAGATRVLKADFQPDRWCVYFRANASVTLRVATSQTVPVNLVANADNASLAPTGAHECQNGRRLILSARNDTLAILNSGTTPARVFVVAFGGGAEFDISSVI